MAHVPIARQSVASPLQARRGALPPAHTLMTNLRHESCMPFLIVYSWHDHKAFVQLVRLSSGNQQKTVAIVVKLLPLVVAPIIHSACFYFLCGTLVCTSFTQLLHPTTYST